MSPNEVQAPNESELRARHEGEIDPVTGSRRGGCICRHVPHVDCPVRDALALLDAERGETKWLRAELAARDTTESETDRFAGALIRSWNRERGDCDITIRDGECTLRPRTWRLALAMRLSVLEADRDHWKAIADQTTDAPLRPVCSTQAGHVHGWVAIDEHRRRIDEVRAAYERQFREVRAALGVPDAMLLIDGARSIRGGYDSALQQLREIRRVDGEISEAKERLAKLTGTAFVHGPSLAQHIEKVEALIRPKPPAPTCVRVSCSECGDSHDCYDRRASVVVEEDDGDPA